MENIIPVSIYLANKNVQKCRYQMYCVRRVSGIIFNRYAQCQNIWNPNNFKVFGSKKTKEPKQDSQTHKRLYIAFIFTQKSWIEIGRIEKNIWKWRTHEPSSLFSHLSRNELSIKFAVTDLTLRNCPYQNNLNQNFTIVSYLFCIYRFTRFSQKFNEMK
jgi:hypothetical protein